MNLDKYKDGLLMDQFKHIPEISCYNHNYYVGFGKDLLYAWSDDDRTTEWWLVDNLEFNYLGETYSDKTSALHRYKNRNT